MADVSTGDIAGYAQYLKAQGVSDSDIHGYTKYLADQHGVEHSLPSKSDIAQDLQLSPRSKSLITGSPFSDTGRQGELGERLDSYIGAPVRAGLQAMADNKGIGGAISAGASQFGKDPSNAPSGFDVANKMGIQNPYLGAAVATGVDLAQLPILEAPVAGAKFLKEVGPVAGEAIQAGTKAAGEMASGAAKKFGKVFANIPEETTSRYLENPKAINSAPSREAIADDILTKKRAADDQLAKAHDDLVTAKQALSENKTDVRSGLQDQKYQSNQDLNEAQANFNEKKKNFKEALKTNSLTSMASDVQGAVQDLKKQVVDGSNKAYEILENSKAKVSTDPLRKQLQNTINGMRINGVYESPEAEKAAQELQGWQQRLFDMTKNTDGELTAPQAKQVMQRIDQITQYSKQAGTFSPDTERALKGLRSAIDQDVKAQVPAYSKHMEGVADKAQLLNHASDLYGTPEKAISNLNNIDSERGQALHTPVIRALSKETGRDLIKPVENYLVNQKVLSTPSMFDKAVENLPESKALSAAKAKAEALSNPEYARSITERANAPYLEKINAAEAAKESAQGNSKLFSGITPDSVTAKTKALGSANDYGAKERFGNIDKALGTDFEKQIQTRNDADQFSKTDTHGSRKTIMGTIAGLAAGAMAGHPILGAEIGGAAGHSLDKYSGQVFKSMLDRGIGIGEATKKASEKLSKVLSDPKILEAVSNKDPKAIDSAIVAAIRRETGDVSKVASNDNDKPMPKGGYEKWANDGLNKLLDHSGDKSLSDKKSALLDNPKTKQLLISASDLKPGSKAMADVLSKIKTQLGKDR